MPDTPKDWEDANRGKAQDAFNLSASNQQIEQTQGRDSEMVKRSKPQPTLTPNGQLRQSVDRAVHNEELGKERAADEARRQEALKKMELLKSIDQKQEPSRNQTQSRSSEKTPSHDEKLAKARALNALAQEFNKQAQGRSQGRSMGR